MTTNCIRCGADVALSSDQRMYVTSDGGYVCPSSLPGEASVHRVAATYAKPQRKATLGSLALGIGKAYLGFKAGQFIGGGFGSAQRHEAEQQRFFDRLNQINL